MSVLELIKIDIEFLSDGGIKCVYMRMYVFLAKLLPLDSKSNFEYSRTLIMAKENGLWNESSNSLMNDPFLIEILQRIEIHFSVNFRTY